MEEDKYYIAKKLGLTRAAFDEILDLSPKWYWDYPNDERKLAFIYDTYRLLYRKEKLDRF